MQDAQNHQPDHKATLAELTAMAMDIARVLHKQITQADAEGEPQAEQAATFDRIARCIRRTVLLAQHLATSPAAATPKNTTQTRRQVIRTVEDAIHDAKDSLEHPDTLRRELVERLEHPDMEHDLQTRPTEDVIQDIERDLGVHPFGAYVPRPRRTPADIARLHAQAQGTATGTATGTANGTAQGNNDPAATAWTHSTPPPAIRPRERKGPDGLTPSDRALHHAVLATAQPPGARPPGTGPPGA